MSGTIKNVVIALIRNQDGKLLIARRHDEDIPDAHGKWELVGGKVEYGEHPDETVVREVLEETGLEVKSHRFLSKVYSQFWKDRHGKEFQVLLLPYECQVEHNGSSIKSNDPKISELKFVEPHEAKNHDFLPLDLEMVSLILPSNI